LRSASFAPNFRRLFRPRLHRGRFRLAFQRWQEDHFPPLLHTALSLQFFCQRSPAVRTDVIFSPLNLPE
jgi:hypothetical protein